MKREVIPFRLSTATEAHALAKYMDRPIYVELFGIVGVLQVYPGGRSILWPATTRYQQRLTPDAELRKAWAKMTIERLGKRQ